MKKEFWIEKWQNNQTGFHKTSVHPLLIKYIQQLNLKQGDTVFVPLCGKSIDMLWLHDQGYKVIGVELSELAVEQFFTENNLTYDKKSNGGFNIYSHGNIRIYQGDFFKLTADYCKDVKVVYDRAALIALPEGLVEKYVAKMQEILSANVKELLVTLELKRTTTDALGPPFSVSDLRVHALFAHAHKVELLQENDIVEREQGFKKLGCAYVYERAYLITK